MIVELDKSQKQIKKAAWEFARGEFDKDRLLELEKAGEFPVEIWQKAADLGFIGLHYDEEFSGGGLGFFDTLITAEAFCRKDSSCGTALMLSGFSGELIMNFGSKEQKQNYLEPLALGTKRCGNAFFEPQKGYELSDISTTAVKDGDQWVISGCKTWVVNGADADFFTVLCQSDDTGGQGVLLLVDKKIPGVTITPMARKLGNTMAAWAEVDFNNVRVDQDCVIGSPGKGITHVNHFLDQVCLLNSGMALGIAQGAMDRALVYAKEREQFSKKIAQFQTLRHKLADMTIKIETTRAVVYGAAKAYDKKRKAPVLPSMAMEYACEAAEAVTDEALQIHGGYGYMHEGEVEHFYRDAKFLRLFCSTPDLRKDGIADHVIGKLKPVNKS